MLRGWNRGTIKWKIFQSSGCLCMPIDSIIPECEEREWFPEEFYSHKRVADFPWFSLFIFYLFFLFFFQHDPPPAWIYRCRFFHGPFKPPCKRARLQFITRLNVSLSLLINYSQLKRNWRWKRTLRLAETITLIIHRAGKLVRGNLRIPGLARIFDTRTRPPLLTRKLFRKR